MLDCKAVRICAYVTYLICLCDLATAQKLDDLQLCGGQLFNPEERLEACQRAIESGKYSGRDLAMAHVFRGNTYAYYQEYKKAIEDYTFQIQTDPRSAYGLTSRGTVYAIIGEFDKARNDFDAMLQSGNPSVRYGGLTGHGWTYFIEGNFVESFRHLDAWFREDKDFGLDAILRYISQRRQGQAITPAQLRAEVWRQLSEWERSNFNEKIPLFPVGTLKFYTGAMSRQQFGEYLSYRAPDQLTFCQWHFFFAEKLLIDGDKREAKHHFEEAADRCGGDTRERVAALAELKRVDWPPTLNDAAGSNPREFSELGLALEDVAGMLAITRVWGEAQKKGARARETIREVDGAKVSSGSDFERVYEIVKSRNGRSLHLVLEMPGGPTRRAILSLPK